jgi:hypothetical protein
MKWFVFLLLSSVSKKLTPLIITPRFPDGLTVVTGLGQFRNASGTIIQERSKLVILLYPPHQAKASGRIERIQEEYKTLFQQESVLRADSRECVSF